MRIPRSTGRTLALLTVAAAAFAALAGSAAAGPSRGAAVYTQSNAVAGNAIVAYDRAKDGSLTPAGSFATGGTGTGSGLGNQGAVVLADNGRFVFVVNAGSNDVSVLEVGKDGLSLTDRKPSGGTRPISLTVHGELLYVLNAGTPANITGFRVGHDGTLDPLAGSTRPLSGPAVGPAQVSFSPDGDTLVVTEKGTNQIDVFRVGKKGLAEAPTTVASSGMTPFGFDFDSRGNLIVSDAFGGAAGASELSSYNVSDVGVLSVVTPHAADGQTAACWVVVTKDGRFAYTTTTGSANVSSYTVGKDGSISLLNGNAGGTGAAPIDVALAAGSRFLYTLDAGAHGISAFGVGKDGSLGAIGGPSGLPAGAVGLAAS